MPGERAVVELTLCGVLPYADGEATFRFPLVVAPRYIPGAPLPGPSVGDGTAVDTTAVPDASRISPPVLLPGFPNPVRLSLAVELHSGDAGVDGVRSSLHAVLEEGLDGYRRIRVQPGERLDRDFILRFRLGGDGIVSTLTLHPDPAGSEGTFALTVVPPARAADATPRRRDLVFVLDRSGSMEGWKMVAARRAVARMIDTLGDIDRFSVLAFDSTVETPATLSAGLVAATDRHRFRAVEYLATVEARGGTEMAEPLDRAVKLLRDSGADAGDHILVLITDGQVGNEDQVLKKLGTRLRGIRVFTIGIDRAVNEGFLRRLAERGGGSCELVESEDRLDEVMSKIHRRIGTPVLAGLNLEPEGLAIEPGEVVPRRLPDLFAGSPLLILGRYRGRPEGSIALRGTDAAGKGHVESVAARVRENPAIAAAWARGQVRQLEDRYAAGDGDRTSLEKAIVAISLRFQVLSRFTAYVAIDRSQVANRTDSLHRVTQPVELPQAWAAGGYRSSASRPCRAYGGSGGGARSAESSLPLPCLAAPPPPMETSTDFLMECDEEAAPLRALETLDGRLQTVGKLPPRDAARMIAELAEGLRSIHDQGMIHGEIQPTGILMEGNHLRLEDASAGRSERWESSGPPPNWISCYTPPEWLQSNPAARDARGDIYSLGVILYRMLTGRLPFGEVERGPTLALEITTALLTRPRQIDGSIPVALEEICLKAMARDPSARYNTAAEFASALREFLKPSRKSFWK